MFFSQSILLRNSTFAEDFLIQSSINQAHIQVIDQTIEVFILDKIEEKKKQENETTIDGKLL